MLFYENKNWSPEKSFVSRGIGPGFSSSRLHWGVILNSAAPLPDADWCFPNDPLQCPLINFQSELKIISSTSALPIPYALLSLPHFLDNCIFLLWWPSFLCKTPFTHLFRKDLWSAYCAPCLPSVSLVTLTYSFWLALLCLLCRHHFFFLPPKNGHFSRLFSLFLPYSSSLVMFIWFQFQPAPLWLND